MYLHQFLVDNLILISQNNLGNGNGKLQSHYTRSITYKNKSAKINWMKYIERPNYITKLKFQWRIYKYTHKYSLDTLKKIFRWNYTKCLNYNSTSTMNTIIHYGYTHMFNLCIKRGIIPDQISINESLCYIESNSEMLDYCLRYGLKPTQETINNMVLYCHLNIIIKCLEYNFIPDREIIEYRTSI